jgi:hypothetical protein
MFRYDKKIDNWSNKMTAGLTKIWGHKIQKIQKDSNFNTLQLLNEYLNEYFNKYGKIIFTRFNNLTGLSYQVKDLGYYVNNTNFSLHNSQNSYISIGKNHTFNSYPTVIIHEISHIYFYKYINSERFLKYNKILKTSDLLSDRERNELKEIITVIINEEFADIINTQDQGYPSHQKIRSQIIKLWGKDKDFDKWISKVIKIYKKG